MRRLKVSAMTLKIHHQIVLIEGEVCVLPLVDVQWYVEGSVDCVSGDFSNENLLVPLGQQSDRRSHQHGVLFLEGMEDGADEYLRLPGTRLPQENTVEGPVAVYVAVKAGARVVLQLATGLEALYDILHCGALVGDSG